MKFKKFWIFAFILSTTLSSCAGISPSTSDSSGLSEDNPTSEEKTKYTISWYNDDRTLIYADDDVEEGSFPVFKGDLPVKKKTGLHTYIFSGWTPKLETVTKDASYYATFYAKVNTFVITFVDFDDRVVYKIEHQEYGKIPEYGGKALTRNPTAEYSYVFSGWSPELKITTSDQKYTAQYQSIKNQYLVTWEDHDGTILESSLYYYGETPLLTSPEPSSYSSEGYIHEFIGWSPEISVVTGNQKYIAQYFSTNETFTVTWLQDDGTIIKIDEEQSYLALPIFSGEIPQKEPDVAYNYKFSGWDKVLEPIRGNVIYTATYEKILNEYDITWLNEDGSLLAVSENVQYGSLPVYNGDPPAKAPTQEYTFHFSGWDPVVKEVEGPAVYYAKYSSNTNEYSVSWLNEDGTLLHFDDKIPFGTMPNPPLLTPTKEATAEFTYTFDSWTPQIEPVKGNDVYRATYTKVTNEYTVRWVNEDETNLLVDYGIPYGTLPEYRGPIPVKAPDVEYEYVFSHWESEVKVVTADVTYKAVFRPVANTFTVTWLDDDGQILYVNNEVIYGSQAYYPYSSPQKPADEQGYSYTFIGWSGPTGPVTKNVTFTAIYETNYAGSNDFIFTKRPYYNEIVITGIKNTNVNSLTIPDKINNLPVTEISDYAFANQKNIHYLSLPNDISVIGEGAFMNSGLKRLDIDFGFYPTIKKKAFFGCHNLTHLTQTTSAYIAEEAFGDLPNLKYLTLEETSLTKELSGFSDLSVTYKYNPNVTSTVFWQNEDSAFGVKSVVIEEGYEDIGIRGLANFTNLVELTLPQSLNGIADYGLYNCGSLVTLNGFENLTYIGDNAFENCTSLRIGEFNQAINYLGSESFKNCLNIFEVVLPENIRELRSGAFTDCVNIERIIIPLTLPGNAGALFTNLPNLKYVELGFNHALNFFKGNFGEALFDAKITGSGTITKDMFIGINDNRTNLRSLEFIGDFPLIKANAFENSTNLENITFSGTIGSIEMAAFRGCTSLREVLLSPGLTSIGQYAFANCHNLVAINIPNSVTEINNFAFQNCYSLLSIVLPDNLERVAYGVFSYCTSLTTVVLPEGLTVIFIEAFSHCYKLENVNWPNSLTEISQNAFTANVSLTSFDPSANLKSIGVNAFHGCQFSSLTLSENITFLGDGAFFNNFNLKHLTIPVTLINNFKRIFNSDRIHLTLIGAGEVPNNTFAKEPNQTSSLLTVVLGEGVTRIGKNAFAYNSALEQVSFSNTITQIDDSAFSHCFALQNVNLPSSLTFLGDGVFNYCISFTSFTIPDSVVSTTALGINQSGSMIEGCTNIFEISIPSLFLGHLANFGGSDDLVIYLTGKTSAGSYYFANATIKGHIIISEGITMIGSLGFAGLKNLSSLTLPSTLTFIAPSAFKNSSFLKEIVIPDSVTYIGASAFDGCENLKNITVNTALVDYFKAAFINLNNVTINLVGSGTLNFELFADNSGIYCVNISKDISYISSMALSNIKTLEAINVDEENLNYRSVDGVLYDKMMTHLINYPALKSNKSFILPSSVTTISNHGFKNVILLETLHFNEKLTLINEAMFSGAVNIVKIITPVQLAGLLKNVFKGRLMQVKVIGSGELSSQAFTNYNSLARLEIGPDVYGVIAYALFNTVNLRELIIDPENNTLRFVDGALFDADYSELLYFVNNPNYQTLNIPDSVLYIPADFLNKSSYLVTINVSETNESYKTEAGCLYNKAGTQLIFVPYSYQDSNFTIGAIVEEIAVDVFKNVRKVASFSVDPENQTFVALDGVLFDITMTTLIAYPRGKSAANYVVPNGVSAITSNAFGYNDYLKSLTFDLSSANSLNYQVGEFPELKLIINGSGTLTNFGIFTYFVGKLDVVLSESVIVNNAVIFQNVSNVSKLEINVNALPYMSQGMPNFPRLTLKLIGEGAVPAYSLSSNRFLISLIIGPGITEIGANSFSNLTYLQSVELQGVKSIGQLSFAYNESLRKINFPEQLTTIGNNAFAGGQTIENLTIPVHLLDKLTLLKTSSIFTTMTIIGSGAIPANALTGRNFKKLIITDNITAINGNILTANEIVIGKNISDFNFDDCVFNTLTIDPENPYFRFEDGAVLSYDGKILYFYQGNETLTHYTMPNSVTTIRPNAFSGSVYLISLTLSNNLTVIGEKAFYGCSALTSIIFPPSLEHIGVETFKGCVSLESITFPQSLLTIGNEAFAQCYSLTSLYLPPSLQSIGEKAFSDAHLLTALVIPESVNEIGSAAFLNLTMLNYLSLPHHLGKFLKSSFGSGIFTLKVTGSGRIANYTFQGLSDSFRFRELLFGDGVTELGRSVFTNSKIDKLVFNPSIKHIDDGAFSYSYYFGILVLPATLETVANNAFFYLYEVEKVEVDVAFLYILGGLVEKYSTRKIAVVITGQGKIASNSFQRNQTIRSITISEGIVEIGAYAFSECYALEEIFLPESLRIIGEYAFSSTLFTTLIIPQGVSEIKSGAFTNMSALETIVLPDTLLVISDELFANNYLLKSVNLPPLINSIGNESFLNCHSLGQIIIPLSVSEIGESAFSNCQSLREIIIPSSVSQIGESAFSNCLLLSTITLPDQLTDINKDTFNNLPSLQEVNLPNNLVTIGERAFSNCKALTSLTFPQTLKSIGNEAFLNCFSLTAINLNNGLESIGNKAFANNLMISSLQLPASLQTIGSAAFINLTLLTEIVIPENVTSLGSGVFEGCVNIHEVTIPASYFYELSDLITSTYLHVTINGTGKLVRSVNVVNTQVISIKIEEGVSELPAYAFNDYQKLQKVILSDSIIEIPQYAFANCYELTNIELGKDVIIIGDYAFYHNKKLKQITLSQSLQTIGNYAFYYAENLREVVFYNELTFIGDYAFTYALLLEKINLPQSLSSLGQFAFAYNLRVNEIVIPSALSYFPIDAFYCLPLLKTIITNVSNSPSIGQTSFVNSFSLEIIGEGVLIGPFLSSTPLTDLKINEGTTMIAFAAFSNVKSLKSVHIPLSVTSIGNNAFANCPLLREISLPAHLVSSFHLAFNGSQRINLELFGNGVVLENVISSNLNIYRLTIGSGITALGDNFIAQNRNVVELVIGDDVESVGDFAVSRVRKLRYIYIGANLKTIGYSSFLQNQLLDNFTVSSENKSFSSLDGVLYNKDQTELISYPGGKNAKAFYVPEGVKIIREYAFSYHTHLHAIYLSSTVKTVQDYAFSAMSNLILLGIPATLEYFDENGFGGSSKPLIMTF